MKASRSRGPALMVQSLRLYGASLSVAGVPFKDRRQMCKYLTVSERELDSDSIKTLDAIITGPALKWIVETVGLGYLGERGDEASRAFS